MDFSRNFTGNLILIVETQLLGFLLAGLVKDFGNRNVSNRQPHERGRAHLHDRDYLMVEAVGMNRVVESMQKFCSLPRNKIGAGNLSFLQGLIRIKQHCTADQLCGLEFPRGEVRRARPGRAVG